MLDNGLTVIIKEARQKPLVSIYATVKTGLSSEGRFTGSGISHFLEHMIFKGTTARKPGSVEKEVKSYGGIVNASTGLDSTTFHVTVPAEFTDDALGLIEDIIFHPALKSAELEKERGVILKEIKLNRDDPAKRVMENLWQTAFQTHPYKTPIIGYENIFSALKREDLVEYHKNAYAPNRIILTVAGDVERNELLDKIKSIFGKYRLAGGSVTAPPGEPPQGAERTSMDFMEINLGYLAMGYHTVELKNDDLYALDILSIVLGDWDGSRLNKKLVKETQLLYTLSSFNYTPKYPGLFLIYGIGNYAKLEDAKEEILKEIDKIARGGITEEELNSAKNIVIANYLSSLETVDGLAGALSQSEFLANDPEFFEKYVENIRKLDTAAVKNAARKYLKVDNLTTSSLYPEGVKVSTPANRENSHPAYPVSLKENPLRREEARKAKVFQEKSESAEKEPQKITLPNGLRLILKEERYLPKVSLVAIFLGGVRAETKETNGLSNLAATMLLKGTKNRNESVIVPLIESLGGELSNFSGENSFGLSMDFLSEHASLSLDILEDIIKNAVFPEDELKKAKERIYAAIKAEDDDIFNLGLRKMRESLFPGYPYSFRGLGERDSVSRLKKADIEEFSQKFISADNMVLAIVGDFDSDVMQREIGKRFSDMKSSGFKLKNEKPAPFKGVKEANYNMKKEQSLIVCGFRGSEITNPDKYALAILASIMSGENGRLSQSIREALGLSYALGTFSAPGVDTGYFFSYVATDKAHLAEARAVLTRELDKVKADNIEGEEFGLAKTYLTGLQKIFLQRNKALAHQIAHDEIFGLGYGTYIKYPHYIKAVTRSGLYDCVKKYVDLDNFVIISVTGEDNEK